MGARRLQDEGGDIVVAVEGVLHRPQVAGRHNHHRPHAGVGYARRGAVGAGHGVVVPAVEVVLQLNDLVLAGIGAGQTHRHQRRFRAGTVEAHLLDGGHQRLDGLRPSQFLVGGSAQVGAALYLTRNGFGDGGMRMAQQQRPVARDVVDVFIAVHVPLARPFAVGHKQRKGRGVARIVGHAAGERW